VLIRLTRQEQKALHHIEILSEAIANNRPPRGLVPRITPRLPDTTGTFTLSWETILHNTGLELTRKLEEYWAARQIKIFGEIDIIRKSLEKIADIKQCREIDGIIEEVKNNTKMDLRRKKPDQRVDRTQSRQFQQVKRQQSTTRINNRTFSPRPGGSRDDPQQL
jgi:hypothetical protein